MDIIVIGVDKTSRVIVTGGYVDDYIAPSSNNTVAVHSASYTSGKLSINFSRPMVAGHPYDKDLSECLGWNVSKAKSEVCSS